MLTDLETVFRSLKSELGLRPVYHSKEARTDGHLFITVLAFQFVQFLRNHVKAHGIPTECAAYHRCRPRQHESAGCTRSASWGDSVSSGADVFTPALAISRQGWLTNKEIWPTSEKRGPAG